MSFEAVDVSELGRLFCKRRVRKSALAVRSRVTFAALEAMAKFLPKCSKTLMVLSMAPRAVGEEALRGYARMNPMSDRDAFHCHWNASCHPLHMSVSVNTWCMMWVWVMAWLTQEIALPSAASVFKPSG